MIKYIDPGTYRDHLKEITRKGNELTRKRKEEERRRVENLKIAIPKPYEGDWDIVFEDPDNPGHVKSGKTTQAKIRKSHDADEATRVSAGPLAHKMAAAEEMYEVLERLVKMEEYVDCDDLSELFLIKDDAEDLFKKIQGRIDAIETV